MDYVRWLQKVVFKGPRTSVFEVKMYRNDEIPSQVKTIEDVPKILNEALDRYRKFLDRNKVVINVLVCYEDFDFVIAYLKKRQIEFKHFEQNINPLSKPTIEFVD
jgi:hypothetical protein